MGQRAYLDVHPDQAAQAGGQRRDADVPVARVGDHDDVGGQPVAVLAQQVGEGLGGDLLLALDEEPHGDRQVVAQRAERAHVHRDAGLVVGRAPAVEAVAADGGLERRGVPVGRVVLRLDVVVGVEQHDGSALGPLPLADHGRRGAAVGPDDLGPDAFGRQQLRRLLRGLLHLGRRAGSALTDWIPDPVLKVADERRAGQRGHGSSNRSQNATLRSAFPAASACPAGYARARGRSPQRRRPIGGIYPLGQCRWRDGYSRHGGRDGSQQRGSS